MSWKIIAFYRPKTDEFRIFLIEIFNRASLKSASIFSCHLAYTTHCRIFFQTASYLSRGATFPYPHTSLLTYFGSPITPISLLSGTIHHRSGFSPRLPRPTHLGTYVLLLCCYYSSRPWPLWEFHFHSLSSNATVHFWSARTYTYAHIVYMQHEQTMNSCSSLVVKLISISFKVLKLSLRYNEISILWIFQYTKIIKNNNYF